MRKVLKYGTTVYEEQCSVCDEKYATDRDHTAWYSNLCCRHEDLARRRDQAVKSMPGYMRPPRPSLLDKLLINHSYWLRKLDGIEVSEIEGRAVRSLKADGVPDSLIFEGWNP